MVSAHNEVRKIIIFKKNYYRNRQKRVVECVSYAQHTITEEGIKKGLKN